MKLRKEKPIIQDNSRLTEALRKAMEKSNLNDNPYESEQHKKARQYLKDHKLTIKPLRKP